MLSFAHRVRRVMIVFAIAGGATLALAAPSAAAPVATTILGAGVAEAGPKTYDVVGSWSYSFVDGELILLPPMQDDYLELTCRNGDKMKGYKTEPPARIADVWRRVDGTGIQFDPILGDEPVEFTITVTCRKR